MVLPTARTGITTAVILGIARAVGETAPLLFTAFGYDLMNSNPFNGPQESLPLFVYRNIKKPDLVGGRPRGFAGALVLMLIVLALFGLARFIGRDRSKKAGDGPAGSSRPPHRCPTSSCEEHPDHDRHPPAPGRHRNPPAPADPTEETW